MSTRVPYPAFTGDEPCHGEDTDLFFPRHHADAAGAKKLCKTGCAAQPECLLWALHHEEYGVWGGTSEDERRHLRRQANLPLRRLHDGYRTGAAARTTPTPVSARSPRPRPVVKV